MNRFISKLRKLFVDHMPVVCARCYCIFFEKDVIYETSTAGIDVPLCKKCHAELFYPFSKE